MQFMYLLEPLIRGSFKSLIVDKYMKYPNQKRKQKVIYK